ncbi:hypothetical protein PMIN04_002552 [Paraphaeosphaeria minitans]
MHLTTLTLFALGSCCSYHDSCYERATYDAALNAKMGNDRGQLAWNKFGDIRPCAAGDEFVLLRGADGGKYSARCWDCSMVQELWPGKYYTMCSTVGAGSAAKRSHIEPDLAYVYWSDAGSHFDAEELDKLAAVALNERQIKNMVKAAQLLVHEGGKSLTKDHIDMVLAIEKGFEDEQ